MAKKVQLMTNAKEWQTVDGVEVLVDVPQEDLDPITDSSCVEIEGHRTLEETISQDNMFTPEIVETKVHSKVGGVYHDNVVDGAYEEAILYGNTQVNLVESITSGTKYIPHSFTSFQGNESKIGNYHSGRTNQVAPLVKGVTMVNLCQETSLTIQYQHTRAIVNRNAKPNTKYTLKCKFTEKNKNAGIMIQSYGYKDGTWGYIEISKTIQNLGDDVLLTFTTHEQADSIIIYNNPAFCEDTNDSITLDDIMVIEGDVTDLDLPFFKGMRSVELSRPLTNLLHDGIYKTYGSTTQLSYSSGDVTVTANAIGTWQSANFHFTNEDKLKPNTKYIVMWDSLTQTQTSTSSGSIIAVYDTKSGDGNINIGTANSKPECPVLRSIVFDTTGRDASGIVLRIHATLSNSETGTTTVKGLRVFEWDDSLRTLDLQTIGYFSGTKYVSARALETEGKNLYPYGNINFTNDYVGWCDAKGKTNMYGDLAQKSSCRFLLKKGTYTFSFGETTNTTYFALVDDKEQSYGGSPSGERTFTLSQDTYMTLRLKTTEANVATTVKNIQIERGETATTYEAYQSRYYKPRETEEIVLRSLPNGVCDTFNLQTGELVQNIGETVLDGSSDEVWYYLESTQNGLGYFRTIIQDMFIENDQGQVPTYFINDKYSIVHYNRLFLDTDVPNSILISSTYSTSALAQAIFIYHNSIGDMESFKTWLQENPVTVQYELAEPIITKLQTYNRIYSGQTNGLASMGNNLSALTYYASNYYLKVGNLSPIPAILEPITTIPYDVRLKPSTLYTIKYNRGGNSNSMSFDLGGSVVEKTNVITDLTGIAEELTVKTPAILSHEQLILSGTGYAHNFIIVEGDITGTELPYFEGMKDVKMPIVKNISRNLLDESTMTVTYQDNITLRYYKAFACKPNTTYHFRANSGETQCNWYSSTDPNAHIGMSIGINNITYLRYSGTIKTPADCKYLVIYTGGEPSVDPHSVKTAVYEDGSSLSYESHKENSVYAVQGEYPITSEMIEQGGFSVGENVTISYEESKTENTRRLRSKDLIPVKPNTTYAFKHSLTNLSYNVYQWDGNGHFINGVSKYFANGYLVTITTTANTQYIQFLMSKTNANNDIVVAHYDWSQFHMYELDSTINLRSLPNGVKDELNLLTGEYIQRVGEVVLDGSQLRNHSYNGTFNNVYRLGIEHSAGNETVLENHVVGYCDKLNNIHDWEGDYEHFYVGKSVILLYINKEKIGELTDENIKAYLSQNPLTVQYELAEPIISHVRLVSNNQEREVGVKLPNGVCNTYNPSTGITTVRVGKVVLDGSENWDIYDQAPSNLDYFRLPVPTMFSTGNMNADKEIECKYVVSDTFPTVGYYAIQKANSTINYSVISGMYSSSLGVQCLYVYYKPSADLATFKTYLASNPITVWYELNYPQIQPDIVLPNGVHDEYNPETGVYTKRVGFVELDGGEHWVALSTAGYFYTEAHDVLRSSDYTKTMICDGLPIAQTYGSVTSSATLTAYPNNDLYPNENWIYMIGSSYTTKDELISSLSQNPIKVWYELATPITYQLTPYFGLPQPYAYEDGYLIHDSAYPETTLPPEFKYKLVANRTGQVMQNNRKLQEHTTRLSNLEALIIEATIQSLFDRELQTFELELMDIQLIDLGE